MIGAIIGDYVGSIYEFNNIKTKDFELFGNHRHFTDDTVMTCAVARALLDYKDRKGKLKDLVVDRMVEFGNELPNRGYGTLFGAWLVDDEHKPYESWGNGAPMRVSPCGMFGRTEDEVEELATIVTEVTHNTPIAVKYSVAVAQLNYMFYNHKLSKSEMSDYLLSKHDIDINFTCDELRPSYSFDVSCLGTVPPAIAAFKDAEDFEDSIRNAVSLGGDSDTLAAITGSIAESYYTIPNGMIYYVMKAMHNDYRCPALKRLVYETVVDFYRDGAKPHRPYTHPNINHHYPKWCVRNAWIHLH